jgi:hypothetical protein
MRCFSAPLLGDPYRPDRFAHESLDVMAANRTVIVIPGRARMAWRIGQLAPGLAERRMHGAVGATRKGSS